MRCILLFIRIVVKPRGFDKFIFPPRVPSMATESESSFENIWPNATSTERYVLSTSTDSNSSSTDIWPNDARTLDEHLAALAMSTESKSSNDNDNDYDYDYDTSFTRPPTPTPTPPYDPTTGPLAPTTIDQTPINMTPPSSTIQQPHNINTIPQCKATPAALALTAPPPSKAPPPHLYDDHTPPRKAPPPPKLHLRILTTTAGPLGPPGTPLELHVNNSPESRAVTQLHINNNNNNHNHNDALQSKAQPSAPPQRVGTWLDNNYPAYNSHGWLDNMTLQYPKAPPVHPTQRWAPPRRTEQHIHYHNDYNYYNNDNNRRGWR